MTKRQLVKWLEAKQSDAKAEVEIQYATAEKAYFAQRDEALKINETVDEVFRLISEADTVANRWKEALEKVEGIDTTRGWYTKKLTEECRLDWQNPRSPLLVGMFHDLCKMDNYQHPVIAETLGGEEIRDDYKWEYATDTLLKGHGDKSVMVLAQYFKLTEEEIMCIRYHMGAFCDKSEWNDYTRAVHKYTNVLWTHQADMLASHVEGV